MRKMFAVTCVLMVATATVFADNWPNWRGPTLNGVSTETGLPTTWSATENVAWKLPLPAYSGSTPIIWGERIFLSVATSSNSGSLELWAVDRAKPSVAWKRPIAGGNHIERKQNMSSPSPVTDGKRVWIMTGVGMLKAFDFAGTEIWSRDIQTDYGRFGLNWGYASSPLLHEGALYVQVLHGMKTDDPSYVLKIDAASGKTLWKVERPRVTQAVSEAAAQGDRSENAEYTYGKKRLREIDRRVRFLRKRLDGMTVVDKAPSDHKRVYFGAWVTLEDDDGKQTRHRIVGPDEFDMAEGYISMDAPLARALMRKALDEEVRVELPGGPRSYVVTDITYE